MRSASSSPRPTCAPAAPGVFDRDDISLLLASACLPHLHQAVEIDGDPYWDGGYMGNPGIWPLVYRCTTADVIVQINPVVREGIPRTSLEIDNRMNEIAFNSSVILIVLSIDANAHRTRDDLIAPGYCRGDASARNRRRAGGKWQDRGATHCGLPSARLRRRTRDCHADRSSLVTCFACCAGLFGAPSTSGW
jgi:predicted acylesterase/phospholipase RssA